MTFLAPAALALIGAIAVPLVLLLLAGLPAAVWFDLRNMLMVARSVTEAALLRTESRGAHQREDFPGMESEWRLNQVIRLKDGRIDISRGPVLATEMAAQ